MKKVFNITLLISILSISIVHAEGYNIIEMWQKPNIENKIEPQVSNLPLYDKYPLVGADNATTYYLDTASCTAYQDSEKYVIVCIVYSANGGYPPKVNQSTYKVDVRKFSDSFVVGLESINDSAEEAQQMLKYNNGYLRFLFLQAAKYSQYPVAKIQALNTEAETQLKAVEKSRREAAETQCQREAQRQSTVIAQPSYSTEAYIGNTNSGKFHRAGCSSVGRMNAYNKVNFGSREEAINSGYAPCKRCRP